MTAAADDDVVRRYVWSHLLGASSGHADKQGHGERRAVVHGGGDRGVSDGGGELVEGVNGAGPRLEKQLVEQTECVLGAKVSRAVTDSDEALQLPGRAVVVPMPARGCGNGRRWGTPLDHIVAELARGLSAEASRAEAPPDDPLQLVQPYLVFFFMHLLHGHASCKLLYRRME